MTYFTHIQMHLYTCVSIHTHIYMKYILQIVISSLFNHSPSVKTQLNFSLCHDPSPAAKAHTDLTLSLII